MITSFKFTIIIINFFTKVNICIIFNINRFRFNCSVLFSLTGFRFNCFALYCYNRPLYHLVYQYTHFLILKSGICRSCRFSDLINISATSDFPSLGGEYISMLLSFNHFFKMRVIKFRAFIYSYLMRVF